MYLVCSKQQTLTCWLSASFLLSPGQLQPAAHQLFGGAVASPLPIPLNLRDADDPFQSNGAIDQATRDLLHAALNCNQSGFRLRPRKHCVPARQTSPDPDGAVRITPRGTTAKLSRMARAKTTRGTHRRGVGDLRVI